MDLGVFLAIYPVDGDPTAVRLLQLEHLSLTEFSLLTWMQYVRQRDLIKDAILTYGSDHILGVTVGNEYLLKYVSRVDNRLVNMFLLGSL